MNRDLLKLATYAGETVKPVDHGGVIGPRLYNGKGEEWAPRTDFAQALKCLDGAVGRFAYFHIGVCPHDAASAWAAFHGDPVPPRGYRASISLLGDALASIELDPEVLRKIDPPVPTPKWFKGLTRADALCSAVLAAIHEREESEGVVR